VGIAPKFLLAQQQSAAAPPPPAPVPWTLGLNAKTPLPHVEVVDGIATTDARFFSAAQLATLVRLCDVMLPALDGRPSAVEAETPMFLDFLLADSPAARRNVYSGGLNWLDTQARARYSKSFAKLDDSQADAILKPWLRTWMSDHPPTDLHAGFVCIALDDIRRATMDSKAWSDGRDTGRQLFWSPIEPDIYRPRNGGAQNSTNAHVQAAPRSAHTMPSYPR
jgi:hypothetical protein